jgi:hypothetical protein
MGRDVHLEREGSARHRVDARPAERRTADAPHDVAVHEPELAQTPPDFRAKLRPDPVDARAGARRKLREVPHGSFILRVILKVEANEMQKEASLDTIQATGKTELCSDQGLEGS